MTAQILTTAERFRRYQRDLAAYRRRSLFRRSHARFRRDLAIVPNIFLLPGRSSMAPLRQPVEEVRLALRGKAVWTLDTAARIVVSRGFLTAGDLTGYLSDEALRWARENELIGSNEEAGISLTPLHQRPPMLIYHLPEEWPPRVELPSGDLVVPWDHLVRDVMGTLGWRPDLLTRLEAVYPRALSEALASAPRD